MDEDDIRDQIKALVFRAIMTDNDEFGASECADAIMLLIENERDENYRSTVLDIETRRQCPR